MACVIIRQYRCSSYCKKMQKTENRFGHFFQENLPKHVIVMFSIPMLRYFNVVFQMVCSIKGQKKHWMKLQQKVIFVFTVLGKQLKTVNKLVHLIFIPTRCILDKKAEFKTEKFCVPTKQRALCRLLHKYNYASRLNTTIRCKQ